MKRGFGRSSAKRKKLGKALGYNETTIEIFKFLNQENNMRINTTNTKTMSIGIGGIDKHQNLTIDRQCIEQVDKFRSPTWRK